MESRQWPIILPIIFLKPEFLDRAQVDKIAEENYHYHMKKRRRKKGNFLFRCILGVSFLAFWSGLVALGFTSQSLSKDVREVTRAANSQRFDPSSDPEGFSLYAEFSRDDDAKAGAAVINRKWDLKETGAALVLSNGRELRKLAKNN